MNAIFAVNSLDGFGDGDTMPWPRSSSDLGRFKAITTGHTVVMGSGTWASNIPKPFPNRRNCVLSSTLKDDRCKVFRNVTELMMNIGQDETVFVIGGAKTLWMLRPFINRIYLTRFDSAQRAEITLNTEQYLEGFKLVSSERLDNHVFDIYDSTK